MIFDEDYRFEMKLATPTIFGGLRFRPEAWVWGILLLIGGCGWGDGLGTGKPAGVEIALVNGNSLTSDTFREYLLDVFGSEEEIQGGDELMSRLLDQFLEEQLYLAKAVNLGMEVSEEEVSQLAGLMTQGKEETGEDRERFLSRYRDSHLARKLKDQVVAQRVDVLPEEIEAFYRKNPERFRVPTVVRLRQILVDEEMEARTIKEELAKDVGRFQDLASAHSLSPDKGRARSYEEGELPAEVREAVAGLKEEELTKIVKDSQGYHIFQLIGKEPDQALPLSEVNREIERYLYREKSKKVLEEFLLELRKEIQVEVFRDRLPFQYVGEE